MVRNKDVHRLGDPFPASVKDYLFPRTQVVLLGYPLVLLDQIFQ